jgi:septation ring formation regulator EzrA
MTAKQDSNLEKVLQAFLAQLQTSVGSQMSDLKEAVEKLNSKIDQFNIALIEERITNVNKDITGLSNRIKEVELDESKLKAFSNKMLGVVAVLVLIVPLLVSVAMGLLLK